MIVDQQQRRLIYYDTEGNLIRQRSLDSYIPLIFPLDNGNFLVYFQEVDREAGSLFLTLTLCDPGLKKIKEFFTRKMSSPFLAKKIKAIGDKYLIGISTDIIFSATTENGYEISVFDLKGNLLRKIRKEYIPVEVTDEQKKQIEQVYKKGGLKGTKEIEIPKHWPPFNGGFADDEGYLFVRTYERGENPNETFYDVFTPDGIFVTRIKVDNFAQDDIDRSLFTMAKNNRLYYNRYQSFPPKFGQGAKVHWTRPFHEEGMVQCVMV